MKAFGILVFSLVVGCGKKDSEETPNATLKMSIRQSVASSVSLRLADANSFRNTAVASGAPESMKLYITSMRLSDGSNNKTIYSNPEGKELRVRSGSVDISDLFTSYECVDSAGNPVTGVGACPCGLDDNNSPVAKNSDGTCPVAENPPNGVLQVYSGNFTNLSVEYKIAAKMKGCVTGNYGTVGNPAVTGEHSYCTVSSKHTLQSNGGGTNADFEIAAGNAEEMLVQINKTNSIDTDASKTFTQQYNIEGGVSISEGGVASLTLVLDTNRMLRFYNQNTPSQAPNPGMLTGKSYFFSTVFEESSFVFVGKPGSVKGFQFWTEACSNAQFPKTSSLLCSDSGAGLNVTTVAGWMTIISNSDNKPILVGLMPDDDNTLTIIKGSNKDEKGYDENAIVTASDALTRAGFKLGTDAGGTMYDINLDAAIGSTVNGRFESKISTNDYYGRVYYLRGL